MIGWQFKSKTNCVQGQRKRWQLAFMKKSEDGHWNADFTVYGMTFGYKCMATNNKEGVCLVRYYLMRRVALTEKCIPTQIWQLLLISTKQSDGVLKLKCDQILDLIWLLKVSNDKAMQRIYLICINNI